MRPRHGDTDILVWSTSSSSGSTHSIWVRQYGRLCGSIRCLKNAFLVLELIDGQDGDRRFNLSREGNVGAVCGAYLPSRIERLVPVDDNLDDLPVLAEVGWQLQRLVSRGVPCSESTLVRAL